MLRYITLFTLSLLLSACGGGDDDTQAPAPKKTEKSETVEVIEAPNKPEATTPSAEAPSSQPSPQAIQAKMNAYIGCYNSVSGRAFDSIDRYSSWVKDMEQGPTGQETLVYGLYSLHDHAIKDCKENVTAAIAAKPKDAALDNAAQAYLNATLALNEKISEAEPYYSRENYKDDDFAKGKAMHKPLADAMEAFAEANSVLGQALEAKNDEMMLVQLADVEKAEGKNFNYWMLSTMIHAKSAVNVLSEDEFDVENAKKRIAAYEESADKLTAAIKSDDSMEMVKYSTFPMTLDNYRLALKERMRRVRDNTPYSTGEKMNLNPSSGWMVKGSPYKVSHTYNKLIEAANR